MGASSAARCGSVDDPVSVPLTCIRTRRHRGSDSAIPWSRDIDPSVFRRRAARLRFLNEGEAGDD